VNYVSTFWAAVVGAAIAFLGTTLGGYLAGRRELLRAVHAERRDAYVAVLAAMSSIRPLLDELQTIFSVTNATPLGHAVRVKFNGDTELQEQAEGISTKVDDELTRIGSALAQVELIGGTPVTSEILQYLLDLRLLRSELRLWIRGGEVETPIYERALGYATRDLSKITQAMRQDLARPWLIPLHDGGSRRWYHFLNPRPRR
jgi:hypothetical protein